MTVNNNTGKVLTLKSKNAEHGKFTTDPPSKIESSGSWACSTRSGGTVGPEGTVVYETDGGSTTIEFYFNHPFGSATSSYRVTPTPRDAVGYDIKGSFKGHDQDITFELYPI
ncbi:hypothetical protein Dfer_0818 [Dyadobacter fermentans DSM 18053]|uniref:Uncharacterized protein n=2 Tax=Dyadobacter fermentans TaxID=94254 RepID=C6W2A5_DYAFD|nr:hypothetical protein Dfer_0818 [Dyadobacter fermentans DSM 18053]